MTQGRGSSRAIAAWCFYDWANSAFPAVISTFIFATYFTQGVVRDTTQGTALWSWSVTSSALVIAAGSPLLGAIADAAGRRKPWLLAFSALTVIATAAMWFVKPAPDYAMLGLVLYGLANCGFEFGTVFYNAMLADIAPPAKIGRVSGWGWGLGYAGGLACLVVILLFFVQASHPLFGLDKSQAEHVRAAGPISAVWFALFSIPLFLWTPDTPSKGVGLKAIKQGFADFRRTLSHLRHHKNILRFLLAQMVYTDGLNTLFAFGGIYAAGTFHMDIEEVTLFGIALNVTAGLGAAAFAWIDDWLGAKRTVTIALACLTVLGAAILLVQDKHMFWALALALGCFFGPAQAASRSLMARLAPEDMRNEMFGLFAFSGKATSFVGPFLLGTVTLAFDSQRAGLSTVLLFYVVGMVLLWGVKEPARA
jgi:MFS transporter, UMF1 family